MPAMRRARFGSYLLLALVLLGFALFLIYPICAVVALGCALLSRETYCRQQVID